MSKNNSEKIWIEVGYDQFVAGGLEGIRVERLAKIINMNKSGYYHYFSDQDTYLKRLLEYHVQQARVYTQELKQVMQIDPGFINLMITFAKPLMFSNQLVRNRNHKLFFETQQVINEMVDPVLSKLFADFIGFKDHLEFSAKYFNQVRYMFHALIFPEQMKYEYLRNFLYEARDVIQKAVELATKEK